MKIGEKQMRIGVALVIGALFTVKVQATALYWVVDSEATILSTVDNRPTSEINGARFAAKDADGNVSYMNLYWQSDLAVSTDNGGLDAQTVAWKNGDDIFPVWADLGSGDNSQLQFAIELGNYNSGTWTKYADSGFLYLASYDSSYISYSEIFPSGMEAFAPTAYAAPEPTSALLFLTGLSLMALRRRKVVRVARH